MLIGGPTPGPIPRPTAGTHPVPAMGAPAAGVPSPQTQASTQAPPALTATPVPVPILDPAPARAPVPAQQAPAASTPAPGPSGPSGPSGSPAAGPASEPSPVASPAPGPGAASVAGPTALPAAASAAANPAVPVPPSPLSPRSTAWLLSLPGKAPLPLGALGAGQPARFSIRDAAVFAGLTVIWRSSEKMLELSASAGALGRMLVNDAGLVVGRRRIGLDAAMQLTVGAPSLDADSLRRVLAALGSPVQWAAPAPPTPSPTPSETATPARLPGAAPTRPAPAAPTPRPTATATPLPEAPPEATEEPSPEIVSTETAHVAARPLNGGKVRTIVVDAGHGGYDPGAHGPTGLKEKNVCLDIALRLKRELNERDPGLKVVLTRDRDVFVSLLERTRIANNAKGDLFVSIHNNASPNRRTHGTQVFFFDSQSSDKAASDLVMRENAEANQLEILMTDLAKSIVRDQSIGFATRVQNALGTTLNLKHRDISYAPFYVLARTQMPAILVEVAFITNPQEERLMGDQHFHQRVAESLVQGVEEYVRLAEEKR